jgi:hypothetical protein
MVLLLGIPFPVERGRIGKARQAKATGRAHDAFDPNHSGRDSANGFAGEAVLRREIASLAFAASPFLCPERALLEEPGR